MDNEKILTPLKAIRQKCLNCVWDSPTEVKLCPAETCPLFPFRFGKNPFAKREYSAEQRAAMSERMRILNKSRQDVVNKDDNEA